MPHDAGALRRERIDTIGVMVLVLLCISYTFPRWADWNQNSRFDLTLAIVDEGTLSIDRFVANTGDYAVFEGRTYSDKAPGLSFLAVPAYGAWKAIGRLGLDAAANRMAHSNAVQGTLREGGTGIRDDKMAFATALIFSTFMTVALPSALCAGLLFHFLRTMAARRWHRIAVTLVYSLATIAFAYSNAFYAHQLVAVTLFAAFTLISAFSPALIPSRLLFFLGVLLGFAVVSEYPAALIVAVLLAYAAYQIGRTEQLSPRTVGWIVAGMLLPLTIAAAYHLAIFHTPLPVAYRYSALWQERHSVGFISVSVPRLDALWGITFSPYRGLFFLSPVLLLSFWGLWHLCQQPERRVQAAVCIGAVGSFLLFNSASVMWWGGFAIGPRYLVPMIPFLSWPMIAFLDRHGAAPWARALFFSLAAVSLVITWCLTLAGQHFPEDSYRMPLTDYAGPQWAAGNLARNAGTILGLPGIWSLMPLVLGVAALSSAWWALTRR